MEGLDLDNRVHILSVVWKTGLGDKGSSTDDDVTEKLQNNDK